MCAKVYKRKFLIGSGKYLKNIKFLGDDLFYNLEVLLKVEKITMINRELYYYRCGGGTSKYMPYLFNDMIEGNTIKIIVEDEGYGIENVEKAMEPLYTSKPELDRSGMGFTVMKSFMDDVEVSSVKDNGTRIEMTKKINVPK